MLKNDLLLIYIQKRKTGFASLKSIGVDPLRHNASFFQVIAAVNNEGDEDDDTLGRSLTIAVACSGGLVRRR